MTDTRVDIEAKLLDELLKNNRRIDAIRHILESLAEHRILLRAGDVHTDVEVRRVALERIAGIIAADWDD